jgi:hypothetical protein
MSQVSQVSAWYESEHSSTVIELHASRPALLLLECMEVQEYTGSTCVKDDSMAAEKGTEGPSLLACFLY